MPFSEIKYIPLLLKEPVQWQSLGDIFLKLFDIYTSMLVEGFFFFFLAFYYCYFLIGYIFYATYKNKNKKTKKTKKQLFSYLLNLVSFNGSHPDPPGTSTRNISFLLTNNNLSSRCQILGVSRETFCVT